VALKSTHPALLCCQSGPDVFEGTEITQLRSALWSGERQNWQFALGHLLEVAIVDQASAGRRGLFDGSQLPK